MSKIRFIIVGSGWRSLFYVRIAKYLPESFECCAMLCRSEEKAELMNRLYGVHTTVSAEECIDLKPDFAVVAVTKKDIFSVSRQWLYMGIPVLCETPLGQSEDEIKAAYGLLKEGFKIQVAEQYHRVPFYSAVIDLWKSGIAGEAYNITLSAMHDYHAASIIRKILGKGCESVKISGKSHQFVVTDTLSRNEAFFDGRTSVRERARLTFEYEDGKAAFYDFQSVQYRSTIRKKYINIQSARGEMTNGSVCYLDENFLPKEAALETEGHDDFIKSISFEGRKLYQNPFRAEMPWDETAIALVMQDMKKFIDTGEGAETAREALIDSFYSVKMHEALRHPDSEIICRPESIFV